MDHMGAAIMRNIEAFGDYFLRVTGVILFVTVLAKVVSSLGSAEVLRLPDALSGVQNRWVMVLAAVVELAVLCVLASNARMPTKLATVLWLSLNFANYRLCVWLISVAAPCSCMGSAYERIGIDAATMDHIMSVIMLALLAGSAYFLRQFYLSNEKRRSLGHWAGRLGWRTLVDAE